MSLSKFPPNVHGCHEIKFWVIRSMYCAAAKKWKHTIKVSNKKQPPITEQKWRTLLVSLVTLRSSGTDILYGCHLLLDVCIIYFISCDYNEFFIILYNILKIWTHTIDTLHHHSLSLTSSTLDHSTTSTPFKKELQ
jgi:hypothetical protein